MGGRFSRLELEQGQAPRGGVGEAPGPVRDERPEERARQLLDQAREQERRGHPEPALRLFTRCLQEERSLVAGWVGQVRMLVQLQELQEARLWADKALEALPGQGDLLAARAQASLRLGDSDAALQDSDASLKAEGTSFWRWVVRGELMLAQRQPAAEHLFGKALGEPGTGWYERVVIARMKLLHNRAPEALQLIQQVLVQATGEPLVWLTQAECQQELGLTEPARHSYLQTLQLDPQQERARRGLEQLGREGLLDRLERRLRRWWKR